MSTHRNSFYGHREPNFRWSPPTSIWPRRAGPAMEPLDAAVARPLNQELAKLRTGTLASRLAETTPEAVPDYNVTTAKPGELKVVAWLAESLPAGITPPTTLADGLALRGETVPPEIDGTFIFRAGSFRVDGEIDFWPAAGDGREYNPNPAVAATASQLVALTAELVTVNRLPEQATF